MLFTKQVQQTRNLWTSSFQVKHVHHSEVLFYLPPHYILWCKCFFVLEAANPYRLPWQSVQIGTCSAPCFSCPTTELTSSISFSSRLLSLSIWLLPQQTVAERRTLSTTDLENVRQATARIERAQPVEEVKPTPPSYGRRWCWRSSPACHPGGHPGTSWRRSGCLIRRHSSSSSSSNQPHVLCISDCGLRAVRVDCHFGFVVLSCFS